MENCLIGDLIYVKGYIQQCVLTDKVITLGGSEVAQFLDCWSGVTNENSPTIDCGGSGQDLTLRNYNGKVTLRNKTGPERVSIDLNSGTVILEDTVTNGEVVCRGVGKLVDMFGNEITTGTWNGVNIINETIGVKAITDGVWNKVLP